MSLAVPRSLPAAPHILAAAAASACSTSSAESSATAATAPVHCHIQCSGLCSRRRVEAVAGRTLQTEDMPRGVPRFAPAVVAHNSHRALQLGRQGRHCNLKMQLFPLLCHIKGALATDRAAVVAFSQLDGAVTVDGVPTGHLLDLLARAEQVLAADGAGCVETIGSACALVLCARLCGQAHAAGVAVEEVSCPANPTDPTAIAVVRLPRRANPHAADIAVVVVKLHHAACRRLDCRRSINSRRWRCGRRSSTAAIAAPGGSNELTVAISGRVLASAAVDAAVAWGLHGMALAANDETRRPPVDLVVIPDRVIVTKAASVWLSTARSNDDATASGVVWARWHGCRVDECLQRCPTSGGQLVSRHPTGSGQKWVSGGRRGPRAGDGICCRGTIHDGEHGAGGGIASEPGRLHCPDLSSQRCGVGSAAIHGDDASGARLGREACGVGGAVCRCEELSVADGGADLVRGVAAICLSRLVARSWGLSSARVCTVMCDMCVYVCVCVCVYSHV